jgi:hypothetical protein
VLAAGVAGAEWCVSSVDAAGYERDAHDLMVYDRGWAEEYAAAHWMMPKPPETGAFLGAFPGREWACREAERRGCWAVLQLDDNIDWLCFLRGTAASKHFVTARGGMGLFLDLLAGIMLATNAWTVGAQLDAVSPSAKQASVVARAGFPYSLFLERVGPGRESWFGPFEDDITHSLQYGSREERAVQLQRLFPQAAKVNVRATRSNGRGGPRAFHTMPPGAVRNPLVVRDRDLFGRVRDAFQSLTEEWWADEAVANREKIVRRTEQAARMRSLAAGRPVGGEAVSG